MAATTAGDGPYGFSLRDSRARRTPLPPAADPDDDGALRRREAPKPPSARLTELTHARLSKWIIRLRYHGYVLLSPAVNRRIAYVGGQRANPVADPRTALL